jgi:hypothetical protein
MSALLLLLLCYFGQLLLEIQDSARPMLPAEPAILPGRNSVTQLTITQDKPGVWTASFHYFYTGDPRSAALRIDLIPQTAASNDPVAAERRHILYSRHKPSSM